MPPYAIAVGDRPVIELAVNMPLPLKLAKLLMIRSSRPLPAMFSEPFKADNEPLFPTVMLLVGPAAEEMLVGTSLAVDCTVAPFPPVPNEIANEPTLE